MADLLTELKAERAKHSAAPLTTGARAKSYCLDCHDTFPEGRGCVAARALDCAIMLAETGGKLRTMLMDGAATFGAALERGGDLADVSDLRRMFQREAKDIEGALATASAAWKGNARD